MIKNTKIYINALTKLTEARVLVIGDIMLDKFTYGNVVRISPEAPVPVLHVSSEEDYIGGAGNVARNIASLLGEKHKGIVGIIGVIGSDKSALAIREAMEELQIKQNLLIVDKKRPTITKNRIVANVQQIVRIDEEDLKPLTPTVQKNIENMFLENVDNYNAVIISDYAKGVITKSLAKTIIDVCIEKRKPVLVDPSIQHFSFYKGATLMTPNLKEAIEGIGEKLPPYNTTNKEIKHLGESIKSKLALENIMITLGAKGMALFSDKIKTDKDIPFIIPTNAKTVFDVSGAGDTVIAVTAMCLSIGMSFVDSSTIANVAAGIVVGKRGTSTLTLDELAGEL